MNGRRIPGHEQADDKADVDLFRDAVSDVKPLAPRARARAPLASRKPPARARFTAADRAMVLVESLQGFGASNGEAEFTDSGDEISFRRVAINLVAFAAQATSALTH